MSTRTTFLTFLSWHMDREVTVNLEIARHTTVMNGNKFLARNFKSKRGGLSYKIS